MASETAPHVALFPSAGMGHILPFLRLAATLSSRGCHVTLVTAQPTVSDSEHSHISAFLLSNPQISHHSLHLLPLLGSTDIVDPFFQQFEAIRRSLHLITPMIQSASPPISGIVTDITIAAAMAQVVLPEIKLIPSYVLCTTSAKFFSLICHLPALVEAEQIEIHGVPSIAKSSVPPPFFIPGHFFMRELLGNGASFHKFNGILINSFSQFEMQALEALTGGRVMQGLPSILPIGPLPAVDYQVKETNQESQCKVLQWLDSQPARSVVYVSFGSRTALPIDQIMEIGKALELYGCRFVWVLKRSKVDKEDKEELADLLGQAFLDKVKDKGLVIKEWVNQDKILSHTATGGFVSHCGWNSIMEAAERGIPVLAWPLNGDQKVNAEVIVDAGLGVWERSWGWLGQRVVEAKDIVAKLAEVMEGDEVKARAELVGADARRAVGDGGSSESMLKMFIRDCCLSEMF